VDEELGARCAGIAPSSTRSGKLAQPSPPLSITVARARLDHYDRDATVEKITVLGVALRVFLGQIVTMYVRPM